MSAARRAVDAWRCIDGRVFRALNVAARAQRHASSDAWWYMAAIVGTVVILGAGGWR